MSMASTEHKHGRGLIRRWSRVALPAALVTMTAVNVPAVSAAMPTLNVIDVAVTERDTAGLLANVRVQLSAAPTRVVTVNFATVDGTAKAPADYATRTGTLRFRPGEGRTKTVAVPVKGDLRDEANETFRLRISNPVQARIADRVGVVTVVDDDPMPLISAGNAKVIEGTGLDSTMTFPVVLSASSGRPVSVAYAITAGTATVGSDYIVASSTGTITFPAGEVRRDLSITVIGDTGDETDETVNLSLSAPANALIADGSGVATIDDDDGPMITITSTEGYEGAALMFSVSLSTSSPQTVRVDYLTVDETAVAGEDYTDRSGTLIFNPGETVKLISVTTLADAVVETDEQFFMDLEAPVDGSLGDPAQGVGTIWDGAAPV